MEKRIYDAPPLIQIASDTQNLLKDISEGVDPLYYNKGKQLRIDMIVNEEHEAENKAVLDLMEEHGFERHNYTLGWLPPAMEEYYLTPILRFILDRDKKRFSNYFGLDHINFFFTNDLHLWKSMQK